VNDRQLGERLRRALEAEQPPAISAAEILRRAEATQLEGHHADTQDREPTHLGRSAVMPAGHQRTLGAVAPGRAERQQREPEEVRRSFAEIGSRMGSLFEPAPEGNGRESEPAKPSEPTGEAASVRRRVAYWALAAAVFALGMAVDHALVQPAPRSVPPASTQAAAAASAPPSSAAPARLQASVPQSCLVTAQRADALIDLLVHKTRGIELTNALKAYTEASQTCRKEASP
jgi:hypothetical protein